MDQKSPKKRKWLWIAIIAGIVILILPCAGLWMGSNQLLFPIWKGATKDLSVCSADLTKAWGPDCGNLRTTHEFKFGEVRFRSINGYELPGWLIGAAENGMRPAKGAIMLVHGGGGDRREWTRFIRYFLNRGLDVLTFDYGGMGEAVSPAPGMSYGDRESGDVLSAYLYLTGKYDKVYAMGTSVGAASVLIALPEMPKLAAVIAENPMASFQRLIRETPVSRSIPGWFTQLLIKLTMVRGRFDGLRNAENSLRLVKTTPIYFIHSKPDNVVPYQQTQDLVKVYTGPTTVWYPEKGNHAAIWEADPAEYEKRLTAFLDGVK